MELHQAIEAIDNLLFKKTGMIGLVVNGAYKNIFNVRTISIDGSYDKKMGDMLQQWLMKYNINYVRINYRDFIINTKQFINATE